VTRVAREMAVRGAAEDVLAAISSSQILASALGLTSSHEGSLAPLATQELDLPFLGRETQEALVEVESFFDGGRPELRVAARGPLVSYLAVCTVDATDAATHATLTVECDAAPALVERAMNELRSRSPLPFRTDADAILRRAVLDAFDEHAARVAERWAAAVSERL